MGCDIHIFTEHREDENAPWVALGKWGPDPNSDESAESLDWIDLNIDQYQQWYQDGRSPHPDIVRAANQPDAPRLLDSPFAYNGRNYFLFAALAGVRNSTLGITPIVPECKGMPDDVSVQVKSEWARWGPNAHSASHLHLVELALWEGWAQTFAYEVWVAEGGRLEAKRLSDDRFERLTSVANHLGTLPPRSPDAWNLSTCSWSSDPRPWRTLRYNARLDVNLGEEWLNFMLNLHRVGMQRGPANVRVVFWFDN